jgi:hypothetical protein
VGGLVLAFALFAAKRRWDGETLARSLRGPARSLCNAYHPKEAGGCLADCRTRLAASEAQSALRAARGFAALPTHPHAETEARLARVRAASAAVKDALAATCSFKREPYAPIDADIERCAAAVRATRTVGELIDAADDLAAFASARSGATFVSMKMGTCPDE